MAFEAGGGLGTVLAIMGVVMVVVEITIYPNSALLWFGILLIIIGIPVALFGGEESYVKVSRR
ncbi:MAG: hypothetical protein M1144_01935 [Candidatus Thermoplasmatota archaeon]|jgi:uncharacterized membrane protein|nr:hypothetical protein [Candidatus Thermoplasmatota archaeon]MCL5984044.1 hypothetical protein [Candidatus Thermoplasmatota archaeon]